MDTAREVTKARLEGVVRDISVLGLDLSVESASRIGVTMSVDGLRGFPPRPADTTYSVAQSVSFSGLMSDADILEVVLRGVLCCVMHEVQEQFLYRGELVADPHAVGAFYPTDYTTRSVIRLPDA